MTNNTKVGVKNMICWQARAVSKTVNVLVMIYLMIYCTDTLQVPAAIVSGILVLSKFLDGVTDMVAGYIVDKTKTKWGKGRPYEVFIVFLWFVTWLLFSCPAGWSTTVKCIWIFVMYALINSVAMTFLNANELVYMVRAFNNEEQQVKLSSYGGIFCSLAAMLFNTVFPMVMGKIATSAAGWSRMVAMFAVPFAVIGLMRMIFIKEKYDVDIVAEKQEEKVKLKEVLKVIKINKYVLIIAAMQFVFSFVSNMGASTYYYTYIVKNVGKMGVVSMFTFITLPVPLIFPLLIKKFSTKTLVTGGFCISAAGYLLNFFAGTNMVMLVIANLLTGVGTVPAAYLCALMILDCAEYNEWKGIRRMEGTMNSISGLGGKVGGALGAGALGFLLQLSGYTGAMDTMPDSAFTMIRMLFSLIPMALYLLTAATMGFYNLNKKMPQIREENEKNRAKILEEKNVAE